MAALLGHVVLRGTRISEMRQKWIDDQRADLATVRFLRFPTQKLPARKRPNFGRMRPTSLRDLAPRRSVTKSVTYYRSGASDSTIPHGPENLANQDRKSVV